MTVSVVQHGTAIQIDSRTLPLRELLDPRHIAPRCTRAMQARLDGAVLTLVLQDGTTHHVALAQPPASGHDSSKPSLLVRNIGQLLTMQGDGVGLVQDAAVVCSGSRVTALGPEAEVCAALPELAATKVVDARGGVVTPGLVDPHTHPVFAGERSVEFGLKARGASYLEIHKSGGGIHSTVRATREASFDTLAAVCADNLTRLLSWGVTTVEGKSGYALETDGELRMLEVLRAVGNLHPVDVVPTLLGAHALPPEYADDRDGYLRQVTQEMIPRAAEQGLARYCDAYCEDGAFTRQEVERIFRSAAEHGLGLRLHAEQFTDQSGAELAARMGAASADHLEAISPDGIAAMAQAGTVAVLLPGAALTCRCPWPPARALLDAGVPVALGTDLNPGSSYSASLPLMMSLACMQMRMSCEETWRAVTVEAARAVGRPELGQLSVGSPADMVLFRAPDYRYVPYHYGENHAELVLKAGRVVVGQPTAI